MITLKLDIPQEKDYKQVAREAIRREYAYAEKDGDRVYVGFTRFVYECRKSEANIHVIANGVHLFYTDMLPEK